MSLSPGTPLDSYEILGPPGAGGMGEVYRARDTKLDRDVAIKVLRPHLAERPGPVQSGKRTVVREIAPAHVDAGLRFTVTAIADDPAVYPDTTLQRLSFLPP